MPVTDLSLVYLAVFIAFNKAMRGGCSIFSSIVTHALPTLMVVFFLYRIVTPIRARGSVIWLPWPCVVSPLNPVELSRLCG
jgi:hypothetical protein